MLSKELSELASSCKDTHVNPIGDGGIRLVSGKCSRSMGFAAVRS
jgi:hypothetical protein